MKTIIKIFICLSLIYTPFFAFAGAAEKWEVLENNYDHQSNKVEIETRKITQQASNSGRYKVEIPVNTNTLGATAKRMLWAGVAVGAITSLVEGVGWIIDTASKTIKRPKDNSQICSNCTGQYIWYPTPSLTNNQFVYYSSPSKSILINLFNTYLTSNGYQQPEINITSTKDWGTKIEYYHTTTSKNKPQITGVLTFVRIPNPNYNPNAPVPSPEYEIMSDSQLGNEILGNGTEPNSRTSPANDIITDAYSPNNPVQTAPGPQETLRALELANPQPETEPKGESETEPEIDPETGEATGNEKTTFELPNFCEWAPAVCDFFSVQKADNKDIKNNQREQIQQDKTFFEKVAEWFDWSQANDDLPDNESPEIVEHVTPELQENAISWGASCPADVSIPISMQGVSSTLVFSWSPWCQLLSIIKPAIVASAYIGAAFIVLGLRT